MWIMSQDETLFVKANLIRVVGKQIYATTEAGEDEFLGEYESEEKAKQAVTALVSAIIRDARVIQMP